MADAALPIGMSVTIDVRNPEYADRGVWIVVDNNYNADRAVVEQANSDGQRCRIAVLRSNCRSVEFRCEHDLEFFDVLAWCPGDNREPGFRRQE